MVRKQLKAQGQIVSEGSNVNRVWLVRPAVLPAAAAPAKYFGPTRPPDSRSRPDQPSRHQSAVALQPVTDAGKRAGLCRRTFDRCPAHLAKVMWIGGELRSDC